MKYYTPRHKQLTLDLVRSSLDSLDKSNRWVMMGDLLPWADIEKEYNSRLGNKEKGAGNKPARDMAVYNEYGHSSGLCLHPSLGGSRLIQQALINNQISNNEGQD